MKLLTPILVLFVGLSAMAQYHAELDPARRAEIDARNAALYGGPGYVTPGNADIYRPNPPMPPRRPVPPRPPAHPRPPVVRPPAPGYGDVGPQMTVRWIDNGKDRLDKIVSSTVTVYVGNVLTNEVLVRAIDGRINVQSAVAYLTDGRIVPLTALEGSLRKNGERRSLLDYYYSVRVNRIEILATSENLIGSRASMQVLVGLAQ